jgi:molybdenum cofactor guanylyltransferase
MAARVTGVILAGGRASRLGGRAKGLERVGGACGGARIVDRVADALRAAADELLVVSDHPDAARWLPDARAVGDLLPGLGPASGVHAALAHARGPVLVVAWDMPNVPPALLAELRALGERGGADAAVPASGAPGGAEPLCGWYDVGCLAPLARRLAAPDGGDRSLVGLLAEVRVARLGAERVAAHGDPALLFASVNTPEDLARARREAGGEVPW